MAKKSKKINPKAASKQSKKKVINRIEKLPTDHTFFSKNNLIGIIVVAILSVVLYSSTVGFGYILDDKIVIQDNDYTKKGFAGIGDIFSTESFQGYFGEQKNLVEGARYRPLSIATFAIEQSVFGPEKPGISHAINIVLYLLLALLVYYFTFHYFWKSSRGKWFAQVAFWTALLFATHPIHTEVVANIKGRDEIMAMLGSMGALIWSIKYGRTNQLKYLVFAGIAFLFGMFSKENTITFLAVIPLAMYLDRARLSTGNTLMKSTIVMLAMSLFYIMVRYSIIGYLLGSGEEITELMNNPFVDMSFIQKYATIILSLLMYIKLLVFPYPLSHDYYPYALQIQEIYNPLVLLSIAFHIGLFILGIRWFKNKSKLALLPFFYFFTLSISSNLFISVGTFMNERFLFMPSLAYTIALPYLLHVALPSWKSIFKEKSVITLGLLSLIVIGYMFISFNRMPVWNNHLDLNKSAVAVCPNSARANCFYGIALFKQAADLENRDEKIAMYQEANNHFEKAIEIYPTYYNALKMRAGVAGEMFKMDRDIDKLLKIFTECATVKPNIDHLAAYHKYLNGKPEYQLDMVNYYLKVGYQELGLKQRNWNWALTYLSYAQEIDPTNPQVIAAINDLRGKAGR